jgi:hypothetical protein
VLGAGVCVLLSFGIAAGEILVVHMLAIGGVPTCLLPKSIMLSGENLPPSNFFVNRRSLGERGEFAQTLSANC